MLSADWKINKTHIGVSFHYNIFLRVLCGGMEGSCVVAYIERWSYDLRFWIMISVFSYDLRI